MLGIILIMLHTVYNAVASLTHGYIKPGGFQPGQQAVEGGHACQRVTESERV